MRATVPLGKELPDVESAFISQVEKREGASRVFKRLRQRNGKAIFHGAEVVADRFRVIRLAQ